MVATISGREVGEQTRESQEHDVPARPRTAPPQQRATLLERELSCALYLVHVWLRTASPEDRVASCHYRRSSGCLLMLRQRCMAGAPGPHDVVTDSSVSSDPHQQQCQDPAERDRAPRGRSCSGALMDSSSDLPGAKESLGSGSWTGRALAVTGAALVGALALVDCGGNNEQNRSGRPPRPRKQDWERSRPTCSITRRR